jgi:hypothetical protein
MRIADFVDAFVKVSPVMANFAGPGPGGRSRGRLCLSVPGNGDILPGKTRNFTGQGGILSNLYTPLEAPMGIVGDVCRKYTALTAAQAEALEETADALQIVADLAHAQVTIYAIQFKAYLQHQPPGLNTYEHACAGK